MIISVAKSAMAQISSTTSAQFICAFAFAFSCRDSVMILNQVLNLRKCAEMTLRFKEVRCQ